MRLQGNNDTPDLRTIIANVAGSGKSRPRPGLYFAPFLPPPDNDGVVRRFRLRLAGMDTMPALVGKLLRPQPATPPELSGLIDYIGPPGSIETLSYYQVLNPELMPPTAKIWDRIILVGRIMQSGIHGQRPDSIRDPL